jgi:hypothetical protein
MNDIVDDGFEDRVCFLDPALFAKLFYPTPHRILDNVAVMLFAFP